MQDIFICLHAAEWKMLEPHLPPGTVKAVLRNSGHLLLLDCRTVPYDTAYQTLLATARTHFPELVDHIEMDKHLSLEEASRRA